MNTDLFTSANMTLNAGPDWSAETRHIEKYAGHVAGVDEVGRGPLAGPVIAAAVILDPDNIPVGLNDSKKLTKTKRETLYDLINQSALAVGIGEASVDEIDQINILQASLLAMMRAVKNLDVQPASLLIDGNQPPATDLPFECLVKGDTRSLSIAAASIIAKVERDRMMGDLAKIHPEFGWEKNAGYGVPAHMKGLNLVGPSRFHRKSFAPIRKLLDEE